MSIQLIPGPAYRGRQHIPMPPSELRGWTVRVGVPICSGFCLWGSEPQMGSNSRNSLLRQKGGWKSMIKVTPGPGPCKGWEGRLSP